MNKPHVLAALLTAAVAPCAAEPLISEFLAANDSIAVPGASPLILEDWIEIRNPDATAVDLGGWHLTDNANDPGKWAFPSGTSLAPGAYLIVFADGTSRIDPEGFLHADFKLSAGGEHVALTRPDESVASSFGPAGEDFPDQDADVSYGISPVNGSSVYFNSPTPGAENDAAGIAPVADTRFSLDRGFYTSPVTVAISTDTAGATIYVTTDSSPPLDASGAPTATAVAYTAPLAIGTTTVVRAAASAPGLAPTDIDTQTYIFPEAVASQSRPDGYPTQWGEESRPQYDVDSDIAGSATYSARFLEALRAIPTISVSGDVETIFGSGGIYSNTGDRTLEAPISAEYFQPGTADGQNDLEGFQIDCGLKVQGGASRRPDASMKHSFSLRFRALYGAGKLDFPVFEDISGGDAATSFDSIHLRAMYNNSWIHSNASQRERATMIRDQWMRDSLIAMGNRDGGYGHFVNVYINGLFWGVFNLHERLENDHYAEYNGGDSDRITGYNPGFNTAAERADWAALTVVVRTGTWAEVAEALDVERYVDYVIMQQFGDNDDLKANGNWRAAGGGPDAAPWKFYLWDSERTLESVDDITLGVTQDGADFLTHLDNFPEFRQLFADRLYKHLYNGGALTTERSRDRFLKYVTMLDVAIVGESARWGDNRRFRDPYNCDTSWNRAIFGGQSVDPTDGIIGDWFPETGSGRRERVITAWKGRDWLSTTEHWLPAEDPPQFSPTHGGEILAGTQLTLTGGTGTVLYTLDGSDPMDAGIVYTGGGIPITQSGTVKTRWQNGAAFSALNEAVFVVEPLAAPGDVVISEIHYNPRGANDAAFIEILNPGTRTVNLLGSSFTNGVRFDFATPRTLAPGGRIVLAEDGTAFTALYGNAPDGTYSGSLSRGGERLTFSSSAGAVIDTVRYDDRAPWPLRADGLGSSLETTGSIILRASARLGGTPGAPPAPAPGVVINEVLAHTDPPLVDMVELKNTTASAIDISGWFLSDGTQRYRKFRIPNATTIPAGGYVVFDETDFNAPVTNPISSYSGTVAVAPTSVTVGGAAPPDGTLVTISDYSGIGNYNGTYEVTTTGASTFTIDVPYLDNATTKGTWTPGQPFAFSSEQGDTVSLVTPGVAAFSDSVTFGASFNGESFARSPDGTGVLLPAATRTPGAANTAAPRIGPVVITEISYESDVPFIEIHNPSATTQPLENWSLRGNADFDFPASATLAPGEIALVAASATVPGAAPGTSVFVWENGDDLLGFSGGDIRLRQPDSPSAEAPTFFPQVVSDESVFLTGAPWLAASGASLQRIVLNAPGSAPTSWAAGLPTPGVYATSTFAAFVTANGLSGTSSGDADGDGIPDLGEFALGLDPNVPDASPLQVIPGQTPTFATDPKASGVTTELESSLTLTGWSTTPPSGTPAKIFYRLRFTEI